MKNRKIFIVFACFFSALYIFISCYNPNLCDELGGGVANVGYSSKGGVLILNSGIESASSITYISPQGDVETNVFEKNNNKPLCYGASDMYLFNNDIYIISKGNFDYPSELIVVGASDMKEKERYQFKDIKFKLPEAVNAAQQNPYIESPEKIVVLDRSNIMILDNRTIFRLDLNKNPFYMSVVENTYRLSVGGSIMATSISLNGSVVVDDKLYMVVGGWTSATDDYHIGIYEFVKGKDTVNNKIGLIPQGTVSSLIKMDESDMLCIATRGKKSYLAYMDARNQSSEGRVWKVNDIISSNYLSSQSAFVTNKNLYYVTFNKSKPIAIKKYNMDTKKVEVASLIADDDDRLARLTTGITFDDKSKDRFFISATDEFTENTDESGSTFFKPSLNILLEYKVNKDGTIKLENKIENKTSYPVKFIYY